LYTLWPYVVSKRFDGEIPWEKDGGLRVCCPNPNDLVVFELRVYDY
jgi:uncharacterized repeat protein (TIGR04076 family)